MNKDKLKATYDQIADEYTRRIYGELHHKPLDREMLQDFAEKVRGSGLVCDLGCGPGHVARYPRDLGINVFGIDDGSRPWCRSKLGSNTTNRTCIPLLTMTSFFKKVRFVREIALHSNDQDAAWRWKTVGMARPGVCGVS
jgi:SAM-dependent methyltransferase